MQKQGRNLEKVLEKRLFEEVKKRNGRARKFFSAVSTGWPDRDILLPGNRYYPVELKTEGKTPTPLQKSRHRWLTENGFKIFVIDTHDKLDEFLNMIDCDI